MKLKNSIENLIIAVVVAVVALFVFNQLKFKPMQKQFKEQIEEQNILIEDLSRIEKYRIDNNFDKVKTKDGQINLQVNSEINKSESDSLIVEPEGKKEKKKGFFNRLFN